MSSVHWSWPSASGIPIDEEKSICFPSGEKFPGSSQRAPAGVISFLLMRAGTPLVLTTKSAIYSFHIPKVSPPEGDPTISAHTAFLPSGVKEGPVKPLFLKSVSWYQRSPVGVVIHIFSQMQQFNHALRNQSGSPIKS